MLTGDALLEKVKELCHTEPTKLVDNYVNFIMDSMSQQIKEEMLYEYLVNEYKDLSEKELTQQILENYGDEWFEYVKENN
jgi:hypothetical protein